MLTMGKRRRILCPMNNVAIVNRWGKVVGTRAARKGDWAMRYGSAGEVRVYADEATAREMAEQHDAVFASIDGDRCQVWQIG